MKIEKIISRVSGVVVIAIIAVIGFITSFYTVSETQQAVVTTFGKVSSVVDAGPHFRAPFGIQEIEKVAVNITQKMTIGYYEDSNGQVYTADEESLMITGDYNLVNIDFFVEWKVSDPVAYLYNSNNPQEILRNITMSAARNVIGSKKVDDVLTTGKEAIQAEIEENIKKSLEIYDIGIALQDVKIQDSEPPTAEVSQAFSAVEDARQAKESEINNAKAYQNHEIPDARAQADKTIKDAEAYKQARIAEATGEVARFSSMYEEYAAFPSVTKTRMYLETIEEIFPDVDIYINTSNGGVQSLLPLDTFMNTNITTTGGAANVQ